MNTAATPDPNVLAQLPATIGDPNQPDPNAVVTPGPTAEQQEIAALKAQLEQQRAESTARETRFQNSLDILMANRNGPAPAPQAPPELSLDDLPDPVTNPKEFKAALAKRVGGHVAAHDASAQQALMGQMARGQALDSLWNSFNVAHPELAKKRALAEAATGLEFREISSRGADPVAVAMQNPDSLIAAIAKRMNAELGIGAAAPGTAPTGGAPAASAARAGGIAAGSTGGGAPAPAPAAVPKFNDQIRDAQRKMGLY